MTEQQAQEIIKNRMRRVGGIYQINGFVDSSSRDAWANVFKSEGKWALEVRVWNRTDAMVVRSANGFATRREALDELETTLYRYFPAN